MKTVILTASALLATLVFSNTLAASAQNDRQTSPDDGDRPVIFNLPVDASKQELGDYLRTLKPYTPDLLEYLDQLSLANDSSDLTDKQLEAITSATKTASLLADLPYPPSEVRDAVQKAISAYEVGMVFCEEADPKPASCEPLRAHGSFLKARVTSSQLIELTARDDGRSLATSKAHLTQIENTLPSLIDVLLTEESEPVMNEIASDMACYLRASEAMAEVQFGEDQAAAIQSQYRSVLADLFDLTNLPLCDDSGYSCRAAERCARSTTAGDCQKFKVERLRAWCPGVKDELASSIRELR